MSIAQAGVVSRDWANGKLTLKLDDGTAEVEWVSSVAVRFVRTWGPAPAPALPKIRHEPVAPGFVDVSGGLTMRTKYLTLALNGADFSWQVSSGESPVAAGALAKTATGVELRLGMAQSERVFGLMGGSKGRLNLRGEKLERRNGFFFTSAGYGIFVRSPEQCVFDMTKGIVDAPGAASLEFMFYWGPTAKEILEQHQTVTGATEVMSEALDVMPAERLSKEATPLPRTPLDSWDALGATIRRLNEWSLSGVLYPAFDLALLDKSPDKSPNDVKQRAADLITMLPIVYRSSGEGNIDRTTRDIWKPYLITYLREAHDRGYPLIRPLPMQFSKDANSDQQPDVFMLGDEVLLAPVVGPGSRRRLQLPRGVWTDLRTNTEYRGNQSIEVDAPLGRVPTFVRNGWIIPLATRSTMELHYYPSLGGEFFLWEPDVNENSQFHASPAGEFIRVEIETQVRRNYEWVIHHTKAAREVADESAVYKKVEERALLKPGTWWHDPARNNLHLMLRADAGADRIVTVSF